LDDSKREHLSGSQAPARPKVHQERVQQPLPEWSSAESAEFFDGLLTARETEVLQAIVNGSNNAQISRSLNISLETVKSHVKNILQKLQARDRTQAVVIALRAALVSLPD